ncbi:hypothetical protein E2C01_033073 [Portunus trituberculatus]|uniref:Uncharacterized protein n=1 Tax=Portunus trituberculatus TaxID=210409 RepID=A0A5B7F4P1_PORTR|nr:hypothetical protein [Portunus trituberculatus]
MHCGDPEPAVPLRSRSISEQADNMAPQSLSSRLMLVGVRLLPLSSIWLYEFSQLSPHSFYRSQSSYSSCLVIMR